MAGLHGSSFEQALSETGEASEVLVFKTHHLDRFCLDMLCRGKAKAIYTHRDPLDAIVSGMSIFGMTFEEMLREMATSIATLDRLIELKTGLFIRYEDVCENPAEQVYRIAAYLGQPLTGSQMRTIEGRTSREALKKIADGFDSLPAERIFEAPGNWAYDRTTLLHRNHIQDSRSGKGREILSWEQQREVEASFSGTLALLRGGMSAGAGGA